jgi:hypothetical protein
MTTILLDSHTCQFVPKKYLKGEQEKVGRNDPCTCNSGKKYKACCGVAKKEEAKKEEAKPAAEAPKTDAAPANGTDAPAPSTDAAAPAATAAKP